MNLSSAPAPSRALASLLELGRKQYPLGNRVAMVHPSRHDADLGHGAHNEQVIGLVQEPLLDAVAVELVQRSGGAFRFSDLVIEVHDPAVRYEVGIEFDINSERWIVICCNVISQGWQAVLRRK